jgi:hypothetical protein
MSDLGRHRGKHHSSLMSLTPITFDANTFSCCGGSYFATIAVFIIICRRPLNLVGPPLPTSLSLFTSATITTGSEYVPLQNCLLPLSFRPRGRCSRLHQQFTHFLLSLKFRPHRATRTPHRQHRKTVIHGTRINSTAQQKGQNYTKWPKN